MKGHFLDEDFLLGSRAARELYHDHAEAMPIFDFHCHVPVKDIAEDREFGSITEIGSVETTTSGGPCAPAACRSA